ncbi:hypothetical protein ACPA9J_00125 [Pseudomonas aeruginosa]
MSSQVDDHQANRRIVVQIQLRRGLLRSPASGPAQYGDTQRPVPQCLSGQRASGQPALPCRLRGCWTGRKITVLRDEKVTGRRASTSSAASAT